MTPEEREEWNKTYYARNRERLAAAALARYYAQKGKLDPETVARRAAYHKAYNKRPDRRKKIYDRFIFRYRNDPIFNAKICAKNRKTTPLRRMKYRDRLLRKKYGIDQKEYETLFAKQLGRCAICGLPGEENRNKVLDVDHCHASKAVRGLLCQNCNRGLGLFNDNPERLVAAAAYLQRGLTTGGSGGNS